MADPFERHESLKADPARKGGDFAAGVPVGVVVFDPVPKAIFVGTQGTLLCNLADDADGVTSTFVNAFGFMPIAVRRVIIPGTTCGDIQPLREK